MPRNKVSDDLDHVRNDLTVSANSELNLLVNDLSIPSDTLAISLHHHKYIRPPARDHGWPEIYRRWVQILRALLERCKKKMSKLASIRKPLGGTKENRRERARAPKEEVIMAVGHVGSIPYI